MNKVQKIFQNARFLEKYIFLRFLTFLKNFKGFYFSEELQRK